MRGRAAAMVFFKYDKFALGIAILVFIVLLIVNTINGASFSTAVIRSGVGFGVAYLCGFMFAWIVSRSIIEMLAEHQEKQKKKLKEKQASEEEEQKSSTILNHH